MAHHYGSQPPQRIRVEALEEILVRAHENKEPYFSLGPLNGNMNG